METKQRFSSPLQSPLNRVRVLPVENTIWSKIIPITNYVFIVASIILILIVDLRILLSSWNLLPFFLIMLVVFGLFLIFVYAENLVYKNRFKEDRLNLDSGIYFLIIIRNIVVVLNFVPLIQILGILLGLVLAIPYLIIYGLLLSKRNKAVEKLEPSLMSSPQSSA